MAGRSTTVGACDHCKCASVRSDCFVSLSVFYPGGVVDGVVGAVIDPQNHALRETCDVADGAVIVEHLSHQPGLL